MHPTLFHLGPFVLPTFGALLACGLMAGLALSQRTARLVGIAPDKLWDAGLFAVVAAFAFSRLLLLVSHWQAFRRVPLLLLAVPSLTATGLTLTVAATLVWLWLRRVPPLHALEAWTPCGLLLWGFLALGHLAEGSDPGLPTTEPWGIHLPRQPIAQQPVAPLVALTAFLLAGLTYHLLRRGKPAAGLGLFAAGFMQGMVSFVRQPSPETLWGMDPLEWVGVALMAAGTALLVRQANGQRAAWTRISR